MQSDSRKSKDVAWQLEWENQRPLLYLELGLKPTSKGKKLAPQLSMKREVLGWLIAARSGHGTTLLAYHQRFSHEEEGGITAHHYILSDAQTQEPTEPFYGRKKPKRALSTEEITEHPGRGRSICKMGPGNGACSIGDLEFGSKARTDP